MSQLLNGTSRMKSKDSFGISMINCMCYTSKQICGVDDTNKVFMTDD